MIVSAENGRLSDDSAAILLLCADLGKNRDGAQPLTTTEYHALAEVLKEEHLRPRRLLEHDTSIIHSLLERLPQKFRIRIEQNRILRLLERGAQVAVALSRWSSAGLWVCTRADAAYPSRYKRKLLKNSPPIVFGVGSIASLERGGLAVVGSRKPDFASEEYTKRVGAWAARTGIQIVSGAANGIDALSMFACANEGGSALGIVAESLLRLSTRREFRTSILENRMTLISSFNPEAGFTVGRAMARNRWIYALADRALVVAASEGKGGTWAGAIEAMRFGEKVFVKTGNLERPGNEALARSGAISAPDLLDDLMRDAEHRPVPVFSASPPRHADIYALLLPVILAALEHEKSLAALSSELALVPEQVGVWLARMRAEGLIEERNSLYTAVRGSKMPTLYPQQMLLSHELGET